MTREEAIRVFEAWIERDEKMKYADRLENIEIYNMAIEALKEQRPHGEWEKYGDKIEAYDIAGNKTWGQKRICTNCGFIKTYIEDFGLYSICPNCGTDMREEGEAE